MEAPLPPPGQDGCPVSRRYQLIATDAAILLLIVGLAAMVVRVHAVQTEMGGKLESYAERQQTRTIPLPARRGYIVDSAGRILAGSIESPSVYVDPQTLELPIDEAAQALADALGDDPVRIAAEIRARADKQFVWIARRVSDEKAAAVRRIDDRGIALLKEPKRTYPLGTTAAHVIGFCGLDDVGLDGLERVLNGHLRGTAGRQKIICDERRRPLHSLASAYEAPADGGTVQLTIDAVIQDITERHLAAAVKHAKAPAGIAVAMDPQTGEVLAIANWPTFNPNAYAEATMDARRNRVLTDPYEPGSIMKAVVAAIALDEGVVSLEQKLDCMSGMWRMPSGRRLHDHHPYSLLTVRDVVVKSSNIGMAKMGLALGDAMLFQRLDAFGFNDKTGIDLPGEGSGIFPELEDWSGYSNASLAMGHEAACTPMQMLNAFCAVVNGGELMQPRVIRGLFDADGRVVRDNSRPIVKRRVLSTETSRVFTQDVLTAVVNRGTGKRAKLENWQVVGKTGTAQMPNIGGRGYEPGAYIASFIGAAPARNPQIAVIVSVFRPQGSYYGGTVAAPAVGEILRESLQYLDVPHDPKPVEEAE